MTKIIRVAHGFMDAEYDSFADTIVASKKRTALLKAKLDMVNGKVLKAYQFD
jgi:hypothetical protein